MSSWDPEQYERFRNERSKPFFDLLEKVKPIPGGRAIDLGCGTGELTKILHERCGARSTVGLDNSETMLEKSAAFAGGGLRFKLGTILRFRPSKPLDLLFSNAAVQWVPEHRALLPKLAEAVAPGGQLAIQMPANHDHQSHIVADAVAREEPFLSAMDGHVRNWPVLPVEEYATILDGLGFAALEVSMRIYVHHLPDRGEVVEWTKGTYLTHYQARLSPKLFEQYLQAYRERLTAVLPDKRPFVYTYKRILIHGTKT